MRLRGGFSLIEGAVVVLVLGVIASIAVVSFSSVRSATGAVLSGPVVASALADAVRLADAGDDESTVVGLLLRYGFAASGSGDDPEPGGVSVLVAESGVAVSSPADATRCLLGLSLPDSTAVEAGWFVVTPQGSGCAASGLVLQVSGVAGGGFDAPAVVE